MISIPEILLWPYYFLSQKHAMIFPLLIVLSVDQNIRFKKLQEICKEDYLLKYQK